ncbi:MULTISPECIES: isochorismatase family protein [Enterobacteriaceae]|uniref:isochorismatase family protein n=1 Tax=Enterobacteriaceae TaxID=543 RepID=UPI0015DC1260|nr:MULTISPECIES: isochorismatase family protein [unclassified Klebsiella]HAT3953645.1 isochorismatase family protein [Kluyvera ascorbata]BBR59081.1 isochorismatase [Klebsiella sp. WP4-W18-ESBL-05]BBS91588.1 isochorismatase [Klebsiella sp. WP7-S18-CRE-02]BBS96610.1 isochorismatase [Klebsiella sp. WP7-S18-CRE-03]BBT01642.1 isochorismatase [Klebsiella sp. WP7-S18-ESBL-04]
MQALLIIDMQGFVPERIAGGMAYFPTNSIDNMRTAIAAFRAAGKPVLHVRHETLEPGSPMHRDSPQFQPVAGFEERAGEAVFIKTTSSAFSSTDLYDGLKRAQINDLAVIGAVAGYCVNSTVRMAADLGLSITVIRDAVLSFPLENAGISAEDVCNVTLGLLENGFARGVNTAALNLAAE